MIEMLSGKRTKLQDKDEKAQYFSAAASASSNQEESSDEEDEDDFDKKAFMNSFIES
jgi:hypothetical protein